MEATIDVDTEDAVSDTLTVRNSYKQTQYVVLFSAHPYKAVSDNLRQSNTSFCLAYFYFLCTLLIKPLTTQSPVPHEIAVSAALTP